MAAPRHDGIKPPPDEMPSCCTVYYSADRALESHCSDPSLFVTSGDPRTQPRMRSSTWQGWLHDWEERQRDRMRLHEETTREIVDALRKDLLDKLGQMEKGQLRSTWKKNLAAHFREPFEEKERYVRSERSGATTPAAEGEKSMRASEVSPSVSIPTSARTARGGGLLQLNEAYTAAIGARRHSTATNTPIIMNKEESEQSDEKPVTHVRSLYRSMASCSMDFIPQHPVRALLFRIVHHNAFVGLSASLIASYSIAVGIMANIEMRSAVDKVPNPDWRWYVDLAFSIYFIIEVLLRVIADGTHFYKSRERNWNLFDLAVAFAGILDVLTILEINFAFLRMLRTFRAVRVLRIIRVFKIFKELRVMIASILCCLIPVTWAFALLVVVIYIFAVILLQGATEYLRTKEDAPEDLLFVLTHNFGDLARTIYSLTQAVSGGRNWGEFADPFLQVSPWYGVAFAFFVVFVIFGVLNILTGVFVEGTAALANVDKELVIQEQMARNESAVSQIRNLFREIDIDGSGTITQAELRDNMDDDRVKAYFAILEMDVSEAQGLFELLDIDGSGEVSIDEFIMTCMRLKGSARSLDLATMLFESKRLYTAISTFMKSVEVTTQDIHAKLKTLQSYHESPLY